MEHTYEIPPDLVEAFHRDGVVVLPDVFSNEEMEEARSGMADTLLKYGVDVHKLEETAGALRPLSSTGGSGGVLDLYYLHWKLKLAENPRFFSAISQLWAATYAKYDPAITSPDHQDQDGELYSHPFGGPFDPSRGYFYLDRIGFRCRDAISNLHKKGKRPLQRSLTPHLDCCPSALYTSGKETPSWRPIQSLIALTDNWQAQTGGFECVKGFHRQFKQWAAQRGPCLNGLPPPCVGDFTPIRPIEDADVIARFESIFYGPGAVIAFDWRTPHANSLSHVGDQPRMVSYGGFLPDVATNRRYAARQRERWRQGLKPDGQWLGPNQESHEKEEGLYHFSALGRQLLGLEVDDGYEGTHAMAGRD